MNIRWLTNEEIVEQVNPALALRGWAYLNLDTCRVLGAFHEDGHLLEFLVLQLFPLLGPLLRIDNVDRDAGETTRTLLTGMQEYLEKEEARGFFAVADSPMTERLCRRFGMSKIESPIYGFVRVEEEAAQ